MEAVWKIEVEDFPAFIVVDDKGNDFFADVTKPLAMSIPLRPGPVSAADRAARRPPTPAQAWAELAAGNERFVEGSHPHPNQDAATPAQLAPGQRPFALVFGCADSRVAAEIIFDQGLGDLFIVRTAGHVVDTGVLGSIEYGVEVLGIPLVGILGHDSCGAVAATVRGARQRPDARRLPARPRRAGDPERAGRPPGRPASARTRSRPSTSARPAGCCSSAPASWPSRIASGRCAIVGAVYDLADGRARRGRRRRRHRRPRLPRRSGRGRRPPLVAGTPPAAHVLPGGSTAR